MTVTLLNGICAAVFSAVIISIGGTAQTILQAVLIALFFILSGARLQRGRQIIWRRFLLQELTARIVPYFVLAPLLYLVWLAFHWKASNYAAPFLHLMFSNDEITAVPMLSTFWILTALFFSELILKVLDSLISNRRLYIIVVFGITAFGFLSSLFLPFALPWSIEKALAGTGLLLIGTFLHKLSHTRENENRRKRSLYGMITAIFLAIGKQSLFCLVLTPSVVALLQKIIGTREDYSARGVAVKLGYRILLFIITILILYGLSSLISFISSHREARLSHSERPKGSPVILPLSVVIVSTLLTAIVITCVHDANQHYYTAASSAVTVCRPKKALPQNGKTASDSSSTESERLWRALRSNLHYLAFDNWDNSVSSRVWSPDSSLAASLSLTQRQKNELAKSRRSFHNWESKGSLYIPNLLENPQENTIRPLAHECYILASDVWAGICPDNQENEVAAKACLLITSLANGHCSNTYEGTGWGGVWQSALWAENIGYAAWLLWDDLSPVGRGYILHMIEYEADRFIDYQVPYYRDRNGNVIYEGDTKGEENAWNSRILALASCMLPEHPHHSVWEKKLEELLLSSAAAPDDVTSSAAIDGIQLNSVLNGSNINEDGTVVNHSSIHVEYMHVIIEGMSDSILLYQLAGRESPQAALFNLNRIYSALVNLNLGEYDRSKEGHHFYERNNDGTAGPVVSMPGNDEWGGRWYGNYYLTDVICRLFHKDADCPERLHAADWAAVHLNTACSMINDSEGKSAGQFFHLGENNFVSGETYEMQCLSRAYLLQILSDTEVH